MLTRISHRDQPLVFVTHYPLDPSTDNWYEVLDRLKPFNTKAVLVGHGHVNKAEDFEGVPGIMGRSTLRAEKSEGGYNIVQVTADSMLSFERRPISETMDRWHAISLAPRNQGVHTHLRPDFSINRRYLSVRVRWAQTTGYTIASTPAVWNDVTVIGDRSGHVYCLSLKDGTTLWNFKTEAAVFSSPEIADGKVVFGSTDGFIYCLDVHNGDLLWEVQTNSPVVAAPRHDRGIVYIGGGDGRFRAIDLASGALLWHYDSVSAFVETKALAYEGKVIFGAWDTYLYALNAQDGSLEWKWSNGNPTVNLSPAACWPVASDSLVYVVAPDKFMSAINLRTGGTIWRSSAQRVRESIGFSEDRSRVFVRSTQDTLFCFAAHAATPTLLWATSCDFGYDIAPSMPVEKDGFVYFGTKNGLVCCVEGQTGVLKWKHKVAETIINTPAPAAQNGVVVTDFNGNCVLLEWTDSMRDTQK
jgi:outer membrane protein assembly factor BamB